MKWVLLKFRIDDWPKNMLSKVKLFHLLYLHVDHCKMYNSRGPNSVINLYMKEYVGKPSETDSIQSQISSNTSWEKDSTRGHHQRNHQQQPGEQQFPILVVTGSSNI